MMHYRLLLIKILKSKVFLIILAIAILVSVVFFTNGFGFLNTVKKAPKTPAPFIVTESEMAAKLAAAPSSGSLQYKFESTYTLPGSKSLKFNYYTTEYDDNRIIEMNDKVILELKKQGKIKDDTDSYSINYFSDEQVAKTYFVKLADKKTTDSDKKTMRKKYTATYVFSKAVGFDYIVKPDSAQIIKNYSKK